MKLIKLKTEKLSKITVVTHPWILPDPSDILPVLISLN